MKTKNILTIIVLLILTIKVNAQPVPIPQLVISPQLLAPLTDMSDMQRRLELVRKSAGVISTLRSIQKFVSVVEQTSCTSLRMMELLQQLEVYGSPMLRSCEFEIRFNAGVYGLSSAVDITNSILTSLEIEPGQRMQIAMDTMEKYASVQGDLINLNKELEEQVKIEEEKVRNIASHKFVFKHMR
jgi:hypothetical protein